MFFAARPERSLRVINARLSSLSCNVHLATCSGQGNVTPSKVCGQPTASLHQGLTAPLAVCIAVILGIGARMLFAAYQSLYAVASPLQAFAERKTVFVPNTNDADEHGGVIRSPEALHSLTLCNCHVNRIRMRRNIREVPIPTSYFSACFSWKATFSQAMLDWARSFSGSHRRARGAG